MPLVPVGATRVAADSRHVRADDHDVGGARARVVWYGGGRERERTTGPPIHERVNRRAAVRTDRSSGSRATASSGLRQYPASDPRRRPPSRHSAAIVSRVGRRSRDLPHYDRARLRPVGGRRLSHGEVGFGHVRNPSSCPTIARGRGSPRWAWPGDTRRSRVGALALAATPRSALKIGGPPRPFRIGTPALDRFPIQLWTRLVSRRLKSVTLAQLDYGDAAGLLPLREAIADHVCRARGTSCVADQVVIVSGAQHGLELICRLLLDPGDVAWMEEPGYPGRARRVGGCRSPYPADPGGRAGDQRRDRCTTGR